MSESVTRTSHVPAGILKAMGAPTAPPVVQDEYITSPANLPEGGTLVLFVAGKPVWMAEAEMVTTKGGDREYAGKDGEKVTRHSEPRKALSVKSGKYKPLTNWTHPEGENAIEMRPASPSTLFLFRQKK